VYCYANTGRIVLLFFNAMKKHNQKIIAPVVIAVGLILYYFTGISVLIKLSAPNSIKIAASIFSIVITILFIKALIGRIKEITKGEEDDLGKY
jgi:hypothetical protein